MSVQVAPYLHFEGNCEEALRFYASVFGGEITDINRFADSPMAAGMPPEATERVMHATFRAPGVSFMASDAMEPLGKAGERIRMSVGAGEVSEGQRIFDALAQGGSVTMPYEKQFWGASFGMLYDRFGIPWMVNAGMT